MTKLLRAPSSAPRRPVGPTLAAQLRKRLETLPVNNEAPPFRDSDPRGTSTYWSPAMNIDEALDLLMKEADLEGWSFYEAEHELRATYFVAAWRCDLTPWKISADTFIGFNKVSPPSERTRPIGRRDTLPRRS